jgi:subtilisin family serine protease/nitrous oxidase accessory protein NosD
MKKKYPSRRVVTLTFTLALISLIIIISSGLLGLQKIKHKTSADQGDQIVPEPWQASGEDKNSSHLDVVFRKTGSNPLSRLGYRNSPSGYFLVLNYEPVSSLAQQFPHQSAVEIGRAVSNRIKEHITFRLLPALPRYAKITTTFQTFVSAVLIENIDKAQCERLVNLRLGEKCFPNHPVKITLNESIKKIRVDRAWRQKDSRGRSLTGYNTKIAIIDTGIDSNHPDLRGGKVIAEHCYVAEEFGGCPNGGSEMHGAGAAFDDQGHGTHVASIAAGTGAASEGKLQGVAPRAHLVAIKVLGQTGEGRESDLIRGLEKAVEYKPDVINLSLGIPAIYLSDCYQALLSSVVDRIVSSGITVVAAAGNSGDTGELTIDAPGCARKVITVGASDEYDKIAPFSGVGPAFGRVLKPDIVAPGEGVCAARAAILDSMNPPGCFEEGPYIEFSGTSMAAPMVSGLVALLKQANPRLTPAEIKHNLRRNAVDIRASLLSQGYGRVDGLKSVLDRKPSSVFLKTEGVLRGVVNIRFFPLQEGVYHIEYGKNILGLNRRGKVICTIDTRRKNRSAKRCLWNTRSVEDGLYTLRITFTDKFNRQSRDISLVFVRNHPARQVACNHCLQCSLYLSWPSNRVKLGNNLNTRSMCVKIYGNRTEFDCSQKEIDQVGLFALVPAIFTNAVGVKIRNCRFINVPLPIVLSYPGKELSVKSNTIINPAYGITLSSVQKVELRENHVIVNNFGFFERGFNLIDFPPSSRGESLLQYSDHVIDETNKINGKPIYYLFNENGTVLSNLEAGGVIIRGGSNNTLRGISIVDGDGIQIYASSNNRILDSLLENSTVALELGPESHNNLIQNNTFKDYQFFAIAGENPVEWTTSESNKIIQNNFIIESRKRFGSAFVGVYLRENFLNTQISNNVFRSALGDGTAIALHKASSNVSGNTIEGNRVGLRFTVLPRFPMSFRNNKILGNATGVMIDNYSSQGELIFQFNTLLNNEWQVFARRLPTSLELSYQRKGNYWGRTTFPLFCRSLGQSPSCSPRPDTNSVNVHDPCPYDRAYPVGEWPQSPVCP